jgi:dihydropteroate synthase
MAEAGADIVDVGGESTRPGSSPVEEAEELDRAIPVVEALAAEGITVSIDTRKAAVMKAALQAGAKMINDVSALRADAGSLAVAAGHDGPVILMHMLGTPETMQQDPHYDYAPLDIFDFLEHRMAAFVEAGIARERLIVDPGIGFGKTIAHNLEVLRDLAVLHGLGCPLMVGASHKGFIGRLSSQAPPKARLPGSLACALHAVTQGAHIVRVHDVAETVQALNIWRAVRVGDFQQHESSC